MTHLNFTNWPILAYWLIFCIEILSLATAEGDKCKVQYSNFNTTWVPITQICRVKTQVDLKNHPLFLTKRDVTVEEFNFDDKCYVQCLFQRLKLLADDGLLDKSKTNEIFDANIMTAELHKNAINIWNECIDDAGTIGKNRRLDNCKTLAIHAYCVELDLGSHIYDCANPHSLH